ncbi:MAG: tetratricopeptide repeat protein, partial [Burkholderiales bacterium]
MSILLTAPLAQAQASAARLDLPQAERLLREGKAEEAYLLLLPHEFAEAGREEYDYLLGVAALESGKADLATLIFERVLAVNPDHAAARLDMGRAYFALGDMDRARTEFESARRFGPPPAAQTTIDQYMAAIEKRASGQAFRISGYADATLGHDSNVNSSTAQSSIFIPLFGANLSLASTSVKSRDLFMSA